MKQFFVFIHSKFSQPSVKCETIIKSLPADLNFNFLCVDNIETRRIIQEDTKMDIKLVPCLLIVNTAEGSIAKFEGRKCYEYLLQFQKQQTPLQEPEPISFYTPPPPVTQQQQVIQKPQPQPQQKPQPPSQQKPQPPSQQKPQPLPLPNDGGDEDGNFNNNPTDGNQTSLLDDDEEDYTQPPPPVTKQSATSKGKTSLIAQATAMQKSRLIDDDFLKKK